MEERRGRNVNYRALQAWSESDSDAGGVIAAPNISTLHSQLLTWKDYRQGAVKRAPASALTEEWMRRNGTIRPVVLSDAPAALSCRLPEASPSLPAFLPAALGPMHEVSYSRTNNFCSRKNESLCMDRLRSTSVQHILMLSNSPFAAPDIGCRLRRGCSARRTQVDPTAVEHILGRQKW